MNARLASLLVAGVVWFGGSTSQLTAAPTSPGMITTLHTAKAKVLADGGLVIDLAIPTYQRKPRLEVLANPARVVLDMPGVNRGTELSRKEMASWNGAVILHSRISQFATSPEMVTRLVLEVAQGTQVAVSNSGEGLSLTLTRGQGAVSAVFSEAVSPEVKLPVEKVASQALDVAAKPALAPAVALSPLPVIEGNLQPLSRTTLATLLPSQPGAAVRSERVPAIVATQLPKRDEARGRVLGETEGRYTGAKMSIDVPSIDIKDLLKAIADTAKLNLVVDTDVAMNLSPKFTDCPWDQILDIALKQAGLGKEISNGVIRVAKIEKLQKEEDDKKKLDEAKALAGDLVTVSRPLSFAKAADAKNVVEKVLSKRASMIIDERTNTMIISDLPRYLAIADELIQQLDVQIQQVQIEARVVEAQSGYEKAFGVKWPTANSSSAAISVADSTGASKDATWGNYNGPSWNSVNNRAGAGGNAAAVAFSPGAPGVTDIAGAAGEFWVSFLSNRMSVNVILQALEKDGKVKIISSPKVVTQNNKKAKILSGEKIPYPSQQGGAAGGAITVAFVDANLSLEVTPQITSDGTILMDLKIEKAEADFSRQVQGTPTILHKEIDTQVLVKDGGTAILGGVHVNNTSHQITGVPFLSKLPLLGWLFRSKADQESNAELLLFITPRILKG